MRQQLAAGVLIGLLLAGCASSPKGASVADRLAGSWSCTNKIGSAEMKGVWTYAKDGSVKADLDISGSGALAIQAKAQLTATWKLLASDTRLELMQEGVTVQSASVAGNSVAPAMAQTALGAMLQGQTISGRITVDDKSLVLTDDDGGVISCTRATA